MIELKEGISKILSRDTENGYDILTYIDTNIEFTEELLREFLYKIINKHPILKQHIVDKDSSIFLEDVEGFDLSEHYKIINDVYENFDSYADTMLNSEFTTKSKWLLYYLIDKEKGKYRAYFKIDHSYADGYKVIELLMAPLKETDTSKIFKHKTSTVGILDTLYYLTIGTITIFLNFLGILIESLLLRSGSTITNSAKTDHIKCKPFKLSEIKESLKGHSITVNDFLYSLMIKTDAVYTNEKREIISCSPINISKGVHLNNMAPIINRISTSLSDKDLLQTSHSLFNLYKYSLYIPIFSFIIENIITILPLNFLRYMYDSLIHKCDYVYSNIIGPTHESLEDIHFFTRARDKEIVFNIISSNDNINVICSFKEGQIKDKARYEQCIYTAYDSLLRCNSSI
jgi:hypothetical protein